MSNTNVRRWTKNHRCPICGGCDRDERHESKRCHGYLSSDGQYAHCTREEKAGRIELNAKSDTFAHRLEGSCRCGETHGESEARVSEQHFVYCDEGGTPLFRVVRTPDKRFYQQHPVGDRWEPKLNGARLVPYRLPELITADPAQTVYIAEGEKCVEALRDRGQVATCNPMGAKKWHQIKAEAEKVLRGRHVVVLPDDDADGRTHRDQVVAALQGVAASVRVVELYKSDSKRDVYNWFAEGHTAAELADIAAHGDDDESPASENVGDSKAASDADDAAPWKAALKTALDDVRKKLGTADTNTRAPLFGIDANHLLTMDFPPTQWRVKGLIADPGTAVTAAEPKAGIKTWTLIEESLAVATGTPMFGEFPAKPGAVAFFFAEDQAQSIRNRVRALVAGSGRTIPEGRFFLRPRGEFIDILKDEDLAWIIASVRQLPTKIDLLVLDPLRDVHSGEEDKSDSMRDVMRRLRVLGEILGCVVHASHHVPKATKENSKRRAGQNLRGSSAIHGAIDSGLYIEPRDGDGTNLFRARVTSQVKSGRSAGVFDLDLAIEDDENGEAICATWKFSRPQNVVESNNAAVDEQVAEDAAVLGYIQRLAAQGIRYSKTALRGQSDRPRKKNGEPFGERQMTKIIDRLINSRRAEVNGYGQVEPVRSTALDSGSISNQVQMECRSNG